MKFLEKVRKLGKRAKLGLCTAIAAVSVSAISCIASAEEELLRKCLPMPEILLLQASTISLLR